MDTMSKEQGEPRAPSSTPGEVERLVDALNQVYSAAVWLVNSRPHPTGDRVSYDDGFGRGVVAAAERIQHEIVSIMPDFHDRVAARDALLSHISTAGRGEGATPDWIIEFVRAAANTVAQTTLPGSALREVAERAFAWAVVEGQSRSAADATNPQE